MAKAKSATKNAPAKATEKAGKPAEKKPAEKKPAEKKPAEKKPAEKKAAPPEVDVAALQDEVGKLRADNVALKAAQELVGETLGEKLDAAVAERDTAQARVESLTAELDAAQTELKLAQSKLKEKVDKDWSSQAGEQELSDAREAARKADKATEAARAEAAVLRTEIDRLRAQLHGKDSRPPTLQGVGDPTPTPTTPAEPPADDGAPQKAMPADETTKNQVGEEGKPGFWGRLFKGKKEGE